MKINQLITCLSIALALSACGKQESADTYLAQAKAYSKESQYKESVIALKNAVSMAPENSEIRFLLGQAYLSLGSALEAVKELEKAQDLKYQNNNLLPALARAYLIANDDESILALNGTEFLPDERKVEYFAYKTLAAIRTSQLELAEQASQQALSLLPANIFSTLSQAYVELSRNNIEKAAALVAIINSTVNNNPEVIMLEAQIASAKQNYDQASERYQRYAALQPDSRIVYLLIADSLLKARKYDEAEKYADSVLTLFPNQPVANYIKASARFVAKDYQSAVKLAQNAIQGNLNSPQVRLIAGAGSYHLANFEQAHSHLSIIADMLVPDHPAKKMLIISQFQLGLIDDLTDSLSSFTPQSEADQQFLSSLSFNLYSVGATQEAKKLAEKSASNLNGEPTESARQGLLKLMMNDPSGVEDLELALESNPDLEGAELAIAYAALQSGDHEKALAVAHKWQAKNPELAGSYNMLAAIYIAQKQYNLATKALQTSLTKKADNLYALTELARLNFTQGNKKTAEELIERGVNHHPDSPKALRYYFAITNNEQSLAKIKQAFEKNSDNVELIMLYIDALINSDDLAQALIIANTLDTNVKTPKKAWIQRIAIFKKQKNELQLITTIEQWLQANPYHIEPVLMIADHYVRQRKADRAFQYIDQALLRQHKDNLTLKIVKLQLLLDTANVYEAKKLFLDPQFDVLKPDLKSGIEGRIAFLDKDFAMAVKKLTPFYQAYPSNQNAILLSLAQKQAGMGEAAISTLKGYLEKNDADRKIRSLLASFYLENEPGKSISLYEKMLLDSPEDIVVLNNLAWLTLEQGNVDAALLFSTKAYKLAPTVPNVADTYGQALLKSGKNREALVKAKEAFKLSKGQDIDIRLNYIELLIINSRKNEAKKVIAKTSPVTIAQKMKTKKLLNAL